MSQVLVVNSGSSSLKYQLVDAHRDAALATGLIERIGESVARVSHKNEDHVVEREVSLATHEAAFALMLEMFDIDGPSLDALTAIGHRIVHGGQDFAAPVVIDSVVEDTIARLATLAPLHNPANLAGIRAARLIFPDLPHVAVFDTAFHQSIPAAAYTYAIDTTLASQHQIRRYGFHGTSHQYVSHAAAEFVGRPVESLHQIVFHLGNGASVCAVKAGKSVEVSMGMTPLEGLVMGTRSGDVDPAVPLYLAREAGMSIDEVDRLLNSESGMKGLSGYSDMRDVTSAAARGEPRAIGALEVYAHRAKGYLGNYWAQLGRLDVLVFTAGVGENSPEIRQAICTGLESWGLQIDSEANHAAAAGPRRISSADSSVEVLVVPTNEEREIALQTLSVVT